MSGGTYPDAGMGLFFEGASQKAVLLTIAVNLPPYYLLPVRPEPGLLPRPEPLRPDIDQVIRYRRICDGQSYATNSLTNQRIYLGVYQREDDATGIPFLVAQDAIDDALRWISYGMPKHDRIPDVSPEEWAAEVRRMANLMRRFESGLYVAAAAGDNALFSFFREQFPDRDVAGWTEMVMDYRRAGANS